MTQQYTSSLLLTVQDVPPPHSADLWYLTDKHITPRGFPFPLQECEGSALYKDRRGKKVLNKIRLQ